MHSDPLYLPYLYSVLTVGNNIFMCCCLEGIALLCHVVKHSELPLMNQKTKVLKKLPVRKYLFRILVSPSSHRCKLIPSVRGCGDWSEPKVNWNFRSFKCVNFWTGIRDKNKEKKIKIKNKPHQNCSYQGYIPWTPPLWCWLFFHHTLPTMGAPFWTVFLLSC